MRGTRVIVLAWAVFVLVLRFDGLGWWGAFVVGTVALVAVLAIAHCINK